MTKKSGLADLAQTVAKCKPEKELWNDKKSHGTGYSKDQ